MGLVQAIQGALSLLCTPLSIQSPAQASSLPIAATGHGTFRVDCTGSSILPTLTHRDSQDSTERHSNLINLSFQWTVLRFHHSVIPL